MMKNNHPQLCERPHSRMALPKSRRLPAGHIPSQHKLGLSRSGIPWTISPHITIIAGFLSGHIWRHILNKILAFSHFRNCKIEHSLRGKIHFIAATTWPQHKKRSICIQESNLENEFCSRSLQIQINTFNLKTLHAIDRAGIA